MNSEQTQAKPTGQIPLLHHVFGRCPQINLGCEQSCVGGRYATGVSHTKTPGHYLTLLQSPPLAVLWIYTIYQMDLGPAVLSLVFVAVWFLQSGLKFFP